MVFTTELVLSSVLAFDEVCFIKSCAFAFSFNQSLKSRSVGLTQCFFTVKSDQDSFRLGGIFCTAVLRSEVLLRSDSYESDLETPTRLEIVAENFMIFSLLCILSGGKELSLSKCALTTACGWPNLRSSVLSASLYITQQYVNSEIAVLAFPVTRVSKYVNLTSSVKDCESTALLNCPNHSCHCRGSPLYCDNFYSGSGSFILQVIASANCFCQIRRVQRRSRKCGMRWATSTQWVRNGSSIRWQNDRSDKGGAVPVEEVNGFASMKSDVT